MEYFKSFFISVGLYVPCLFLELSIINITGNNTIPPIRVLIAIKVFGSMYSIPTLWDTKDIPQIMAVINNIIFPFNFLLILFSSLFQNYAICAKYFF